MILSIWHYLLIAVGINILMFIPAFIFKTGKFTDISYSLSLIAVALGLPGRCILFPCGIQLLL